MRVIVRACTAILLCWSAVAVARAQAAFTPPTSVGTQVTQLLADPVAANVTVHRSRICNISAPGGPVLWIGRTTSIAPFIGGALPLPPLATTNSPPYCEEFANPAPVPQVPFYGVTSTGTAPGDRR